MTLYKALQHLAERGHITMSRRRGTFVKASQTRDRIAIPVVNLGAVRAPHTVYVDRQAFVDRAASLAADQGRSRLALIERAEHLVDHLDRFSAACAGLGVTACPPPALMPSSDLSYEEYGFDLLRRPWAHEPRPDAVVVPDDVIAKGVAQAALALGLSVPRDLTVIAMTNQGARFFYPVPMKRFEVDVETLVVRAARMLMDMISGAAIPPQTVLVLPLSPETVEPVPKEAASEVCQRVAGAGDESDADSRPR